MKASIHDRILEAIRLANNGDMDAASRIFSAITDDELVSDEIKVDYAHLCLRFGNTGPAIELYSQVLKNHPDNAVLMGFIARAFLQAGKYQDAVAVLNRAITLSPSNVDLLVTLSAALIHIEKYKDANGHLLQAVTLEPDNAAIHANLAITLSRLGEYDEALSHAEKALQLNPANTHTYHVAGNCLIELGRFEEAEQYLLKLISLDKCYAAAYAALARAKKFNDNDADFIAGLEDLLIQHRFRDEDRVHVEFALGKMYDDCSQWDKAFSYYDSANTQLAKNSGCDIQADIINLNKIVFTSRTIDKLKEYAAASEKPVFIVGMPRSGTTLLETLLAKHPEVEGVGELLDIPGIAKDLYLGLGPGVKPNNIEYFLLKNNPDKLALKYLGVLEQRYPDAARVVDKLPDNFLYLGMIYSLFPHAHVIHMQRNPLDTCLSCYFQHFARVTWANNLDCIADRYILYREQMDYWREILPENFILDVRYEDLVEDTGAECRRVIDFLGLPWDDACLESSESGRVIRTSSMWQARQDVYTTSKMRSRHYAKHLTGLANKLQQYLPEDPEFRKEFGIKKRWLGLFG